MINAEHQGQGFGKKAFAIAIDDIRQTKKPNKIHICFTKENTTANLLYSNFGFVDNGLDEYGQINLILQT
jgi:ribosomal protein S18 acetylase RimI-like enzyme